MRLNKTGVALLKKRGKATIKVTLKTRIDGQAGVITSTHPIQVIFKKKKKPKR